MAKIFAIANQKGGVGKTTTSVNLSASLFYLKKKVLLVDLDPQGNATVGSGVEKTTFDYGVNEVLLEEIDVRETIIKKCRGGFDLLPANNSLTEAEVKLINQNEKESRLKNALNLIANEYDYIILDCPPSLNMLTLNALAAADSIIIAMQCEYYALEGLSALISTMERVKKALNKNLKIEGIVRTLYDTRNKLANDVTEQLKTYFQDKVYKTAIPKNIRLAEAPSYGVPVLFYDKSSKGAKAYIALAKEVHNRANGKISVKEKIVNYVKGSDEKVIS